VTTAQTLREAVGSSDERDVSADEPLAQLEEHLTFGQIWRGVATTR
jgi:hypothetical protein